MESRESSLLVVGAGHAGSELAIAARQAGWPGPIVLLGDEAQLPYHRPPLSKAYLCGEADLASIELRPAATYEAAGIARITGARLAAIDRAAHVVQLADGRRLPYARLALCTGGRARAFVCDGIDPLAPPSNLLYLRSVADADRIRVHLQPGRRIVVIGGGYVGLEVAASACSHGAQVTVIEAQPRVLARVAGPQLSDFYESVHRAHGVEILTGIGIAAAICEGGRITELRCSDGRLLPADAVIAGIGMVPNVEAAIDAGIASAEGIAVDENGCTADADIVAAGDCTLHAHPLYQRPLRIESVPNALEQARAAAGWLCGKPRPYRSVPWFWSDQYDLKLQMAGLSQGYDRCVLRGDMQTGSFCVFYLQHDRVLAVDAVNRPAEFMMARRALARPWLADAQRLADERVPLQELLLSAT